MTESRHTATPEEIAEYEAIMNWQTARAAAPPAAPPSPPAEPEAEPAPQHDEHVRAWRREALARMRPRAPDPYEHETARQRRDRLKRERLEASGEAARRRLAAETGQAEHDSRTAAGKRELQIESLGGTKRARSLKYGALFKTKSDGTDVRALACQMYDDLWHAAHTGLFPEPKFLPRVDSSPRHGAPIEGSSASNEYLSRLVATIGHEAAALLYLRVVENWSYKALAEATGGDGDERKIAAQFIAAVDGAARFFGLRTESPIVKAAQAAMESA